MSTELGRYVAALVEALRHGDAVAMQRLRDVVGRRRARLTMDDEEVEVHFRGPRLVISECDGRCVLHAGAPLRGVDGVGAMQRRTVAALLRGQLEVTDAILQGRIGVRGRVEDNARILTAIEIMLDAATRLPALRGLSRRFLADTSQQDDAASLAGPTRYRFRRDAPASAELSLLRKLDLLPEPSSRQGAERSRAGDNR